jgi:cellobiose-specific phosphotransferase system component IIA
MLEKKQRGGKRPGSGRKKGSLNKVTVNLKQKAGEYTEEALNVLAEVMRNPEAPAAARIQAADKILDRAHGRPAELWPKLEAPAINNAN